MNKTRRREIEKARGMIEEAKGILENAQSEEKEAFDNMSEGLQASERGQKIGVAATELQSAVDSCDSILENIENAISE